MSKDPYRLMGRPESGYTLKVRSALRYKGVDFEWMDRFKEDKLFQQHARVPLIPLLFKPDGSSMQDSTPILDHLEESTPEPSLHPQDPALRFLSQLLEEYGDEWGNKLMFHYRWTYPADQQRRGESLARGLVEGKGLGWASALLLPLMKRQLIKRMVPRLAFAGSNENNQPILVESFAQLVAMLQTHLAERPYLFGARPAYGDFGLWGQLWQAYTDPSCEAILKREGPAVVAWIERMQNPVVDGDFESLEALAETLLPIYAKEVGPRYLAWASANAKAWDAGEKQTELSMAGQRYYQKTFKYPAGSLAVLKDKLQAALPNPQLQEFLEQGGCWEALTSA